MFQLCNGPLSGGETKPGALPQINDDTDQSVPRVDETKPAQKARLKSRCKNPGAVHDDNQSGAGVDETKTKPTEKARRKGRCKENALKKGKPSGIGSVS